MSEQFGYKWRNDAFFFASPAVRSRPPCLAGLPGLVPGRGTEDRTRWS